MEASFFQKIFLTALAGFVAACMIWGFRHIMSEANEGAGNYQESTSAPAQPRR